MSHAPPSTPAAIAAPADLLRRQLAAGLLPLSASYDGVEQTGQLQHWMPQIRDAAADTVRHLPALRARSRDLARNNPLALGAINTNADRVVGTGLALAPQPDRRVLRWTPEQADEWRARLKAEWALYWESIECDQRRTLDGYGLQELVLRATLESGDCFTLLPDAPARTLSMPYRLRVQVIEADRVGNPGGQADTDRIAAGIRRDKHGAPEAYHIYTHHPGAGYTVSGSRHAGDWVDAVGPSGRRRVLHHFRTLRPEQPRGVPYLAPIMGLVKQLGRYTDAEVAAAVVTAYLSVLIETPAGTGAAPIFSGDAPASVSAGNGDIALGAGAVIDLAPGETANVVNPLRPNTAFGPFVQALVTQIGVALSIPHELLTKTFNASYSASRAALLDAWQFFRKQRSWLAGSFCQPVFEAWLAEAVLIGRVSAPGFFSAPELRWAYTRAQWIGDSMGSLNPKDEVAAYLSAIDGRLMTRERAEYELSGTDWRETYDTKKAEEDRLRRDNMLPAPKAGAAAPQQQSDKPPPPAEPSSIDRLAAAVTMMATRPPEPVQVKVEPHIAVNLPEGLVNLEAVVQQPAAPNVVLEAHIEQPPAPVVNVTSPPVHVHVPPPEPAVPMRQLIERDDNGDITSITTQPAGALAH